MPAHLLTLDQELLFWNFLNCVTVRNMWLLKVGDWSSDGENDGIHQNDLSLNRRWKLEERHPRCSNPRTSLNPSVLLWKHFCIHSYILIHISHLWHDEKKNLYLLYTGLFHRVYIRAFVAAPLASFDCNKEGVPAYKSMSGVTATLSSTSCFPPKVCCKSNMAAMRIKRTLTCHRAHFLITLSLCEATPSSSPASPL